jgi:hypothetical protein
MPTARRDAIQQASATPSQDIEQDLQSVVSTTTAGAHAVLADDKERLSFVPVPF